MNWLDLLGTIVDAIPAPVFFKDAEGYYRIVNQSFAHTIIGLPREQILGRRLFEIPQRIPEDLARIYHQKDQDLLTQGGKQIYEAQVMSAQDERRNFVFHKAVVRRQEDGQVLGIVGTMLDVTDRRLAEEQALRSAKLQAAIETSGAVCHELNQPLQVAITEAEYLNHLVPQGPQTESSAGILNALYRMAGLVRKLQTITSYETEEYAGGTRILNIDQASTTRSES